MNTTTNASEKNQIRMVKNALESENLLEIFSGLVCSQLPPAAYGLAREAMTGWCKTPEDFLEVAGLDGIDPEIADRRQVEWIAQLHGEGEAVGLSRALAMGLRKGSKSLSAITSRGFCFINLENWPTRWQMYFDEPGNVLSIHRCGYGGEKWVDTSSERFQLALNKQQGTSNLEEVAKKIDLDEGSSEYARFMHGFHSRDFGLSEADALLQRVSNRMSLLFPRWN